MRMAMRHVTRLMNRYARNLENHISSVATPYQALLSHRTPCVIQVTIAGVEASIWIPTN